MPAFRKTDLKVKAEPAASYGLLTLMSFVKRRGHDWNVLHARQREVD